MRASDVRVRPGLLLLAGLALATWALWFARQARQPRVLVGASSEQALARAGAPLATPEGLLVLLDPAGTADGEAELLATYGFPGVARVSDAALARAPAGRRLRWVVANAELDESTRMALRAAVQEGAWVVELGPRTHVCGAPAAGDNPTAGEDTLYRVQADGLNGVRWPVPIAIVPDCRAADCGEATVLIRAVPTGDAGTSLPLVARQPLGKGACTRWLGDLRQAIQRLRQGDPRRAPARDNAPAAFKPSDLFAGSLTREDYEVPSADRLGFALAGQIVAAPGADVLVSPLPVASHGLLIFTADQDFVPGNGVLAQSAELQDAGLTVTLTAADIGGEPDVVFEQGERGLVSADVVAQLAERGQEVGVHPNLIGLPAARHAEVLAQHVAAFRSAYGVAPRIVRNHHLVWSGYTEMARLQAAAGLVLNLDFVTAPTGSGYHPGFMTGSGLPMRFADERGRVLPIYQLATQIDDYVFTPEQAPSRQHALATLIAATRKLLAVSQREHVPITLLHHPAWWYETSGAWQQEVLREAARLGMAVWGAGRFLTFVEDVRATRLTRARSGFQVATTAPVALLVEGAERWSIAGAPPPATLVRTLAGTRYRELALPAGETQVQVEGE